jgi:hypothetical protein
LRHYPLEMTQDWKIFFSCKSIFLFRKQICWDFALSGWVITSRRFETSRRHLQGHESVRSLITVKMAAERFLETSGVNYPTTMRKNSEDLDPQQSLGGNLKSLFSFCYKC